VSGVKLTWSPRSSTGARITYKQPLDTTTIIIQKNLNVKVIVIDYKAWNKIRIVIKAPIIK
jgi:hypothetical protein